MSTPFPRPDDFVRLFERIPQPTWVFDPETLRLLAVNEAVVRKYGYSREELLAMSLLDLHSAEEAERLRAEFAAGGPVGRVEAVPAVHRRRDGSLVHVEVAVDDTTFAGRRACVVSVTDLTRRRAVIEALRHSEERFRSLTENSSDVVTVLAEDGTILYESPPVQRLLGYAPRELEGRNVFAFMHPDDLPNAREALERRLREPETVQTTALRFRHRDGRWRHLEVRASNRLHDAAVRGIVVNSRDVTERVEAEERLRSYSRELERSNRELEEFAYVASHDLQEPLRKIRAFGDRLRARFAPALGEQGVDYVERMQGAAARMQQLIVDLLEYSRVRTRGRPFEPVDLDALLREVVQDLEPRLRATGGSVAAEPLPQVVGDPGQLRQLLQNLLVNAVKFHHPGVRPRVRVSAERAAGVPDGDTVALRVADEGIGFDEKYLDRIFNPFQRLHGRGEYEGTGMGLAICRRIAERHGGSITARSAPGEGATFVVTLPACPGALQEEAR